MPKSIRLSIALIYALSVVMIALVLPGAAFGAGPDQGVVLDQHGSGYPEDDDLPAYLSAATDGAPLLIQANALHVQPSVLAADGPGGLRWSILIALMLSALFCLGTAFMTGGRNARHR